MLLVCQVRQPACIPREDGVKPWPQRIRDGGFFARYQILEPDVPIPGSSGAESQQLAIRGNGRGSLRDGVLSQSLQAAGRLRPGRVDRQAPYIDIFLQARERHLIAGGGGGLHFESRAQGQASRSARYLPGFRRDGDQPEVGSVRQSAGHQHTVSRRNPGTRGLA